jgi:hypothetical protein
MQRLLACRVESDILVAVIMNCVRIKYSKKTLRLSCTQQMFVGTPERAHLGLDPLHQLEHRAALLPTGPPADRAVHAYPCQGLVVFHGVVKVASLPVTEPAPFDAFKR